MQPTPEASEAGWLRARRNSWVVIFSDVNSKGRLLFRSYAESHVCEFIRMLPLRLILLWTSFKANTPLKAAEVYLHQREASLGYPRLTTPAQQSLGSLGSSSHAPGLARGSSRPQSGFVSGSRADSKHTRKKLEPVLFISH